MVNLIYNHAGHVLTFTVEPVVLLESEVKLVVSSAFATSLGG